MLKLNQLENISQLPDLVLCQLDNWDLICVTGEDRVKFLQSQLTCDVTKLKPGDQTLAAQCNPQGKAWTINRVIMLEDRILLTQPSSVTERQLPELQKYGTFSKVVIAQETQYQMIGLAGCQSSKYLTEKFGSKAAVEQSHLLENGVVIKQPYPSLRYLVILENQSALELIADLKEQASLFDDSLWNAMNIASGVGFLEKETSNQFVPQMLNLQALDGISFNKGCYIGQETIARTKSRGINKRSLFILTGRASHAPKAGDNVQVQLNDNWKRVGTVISGCQYGDGHIEVLAVLPNDSSDESTYQVKEVDSSILYSAPLPYSLP